MSVGSGAGFIFISESGYSGSISFYFYSLLHFAKNLDNPVASSYFSKT
jgi:hypothetical protein